MPPASTPLRRHALRALGLAAALALIASCTTNPRHPDPSRPEPPHSISAAPSTPGGIRTPTMPSVDGALLAEAVDVFKKVSERMQGVEHQGGFGPADTDPSYPQYLMGGALMNAIMHANSRHENGYRRVRGTEELLHVQQYPAMTAGSLVALSGCRQQTDVRVEDAKGLGWDGANEVSIVFLKRDSDGRLKIFHWEDLAVETCHGRAADKSLVADAAGIYRVVLGLVDKHIAAGGLSQADYPTSGFGRYLGTEARNRLLFELELHRTGSLAAKVTGPSAPGRVTEWPYRRENAQAALTSCVDRSTHLYSDIHGAQHRIGPRIFFAHFLKDSAGVLRLEWLDWVYVDACH